jgi:hypothetical protein
VEPAYVRHRTDDIANLGYLAGTKRGERDVLTHGNQPILIENDSQYYLSADSSEFRDVFQLVAAKKIAPAGKLSGKMPMPGTRIEG